MIHIQRKEQSKTANNDQRFNKIIFITIGYVNVQSNCCQETDSMQDMTELKHILLCHYFTERDNACQQNTDEIYHRKYANWGKSSNSRTHEIAQPNDDYNERILGTILLSYSINCRFDF